MTRVLTLIFCFSLTACLDSPLTSTKQVDLGTTDDDFGTDDDAGMDADSDTGTNSCGVGETMCDAPQGCIAYGNCLDTLGDGIDSNHDGSDGYTLSTVFVSQLHGNDGNRGLLPTDPVATLKHAVSISLEKNRTTILLTDGDYVAPKNWTVSSSTFNLWGGYSERFQSAPDASSQTKITSESSTSTLTIKGGNLINLGMVDFLPPQNPETKHAITLRIENSFVNFYAVRVQRGEGQNGNNGMLGGSQIDGQNANGSTGGSVICHGLTISGGSGGLGGSCTIGAITEPTAGGHGTNGLGVFLDQGGGDPAMNNCQTTGVSDGDVGVSRTTAGTVGEPGSAAPLTGLVITGEWNSGERAGSGSFGKNGSGGAGGGGGGGNNLQGGAGGGAGSGGCGGKPGQGGEHGGDSIGILAIGASSLGGSQVVITGGKGGVGGIGGMGGAFGLGGSGADGQFANLTSGMRSKGGNGGNGGNGGQGGPGAGGNGGSIYGLAHGPEVQIGNLQIRVDGGELGKGAEGISDGLPTPDGTDGRSVEIFQADIQ